MKEGERRRGEGEKGKGGRERGRGVKSGEMGGRRGVKGPVTAHCLLTSTLKVVVVVYERSERALTTRATEGTTWTSTPDTLFP